LFEDECTPRAPWDDVVGRNGGAMKNGSEEPVF
jgi:hypothetical protein